MTSSLHALRHVADNYLFFFFVNLRQLGMDLVVFVRAVYDHFVSKVARHYSVSEKTVRKIWKQGKDCIYNQLLVDVSSNLARRVGRKRAQLNLNKVAEVPFPQRTNIRSLSSAVKVSKSTLHRRIKEGAIRPHSNALKPHLFDETKRARLRFLLSMLEPSTLQTQPMFKNMYNCVHIDEKRFYMTKEAKKYHLLPEEEEPHRTCIMKVMFLAAIAHPRFDPENNVEFSRKIGIFPFTYKELAKGRSKNRAAGTLETKVIIKVTKDVSRSCLIEKVLPAFRSKWPRCSAMETIYIQQDNAKPHITGLDAEFLEAANQEGFDIRLSFQPPNSPDMNILDQKFFWAIQSLQYQHAPKNIDELVHAVEKYFEELLPESLNRVFFTLQASMIEVMKVDGGNNYNLPHTGKLHIMREDGTLPSQLECPCAIVENALLHLQS
ncbi:hypothetical protein Vadar_026523 [Vaccinium darrowii]|uniref:Uncharacterized protein n=1 Tax=Vaccinium darrowii TaxID=229202 RepID=A0ACB7YIC8_9ERIC|nr:hypothetical protein Vadar_026523 [Vaccinium darrowii]